ncbi:adenosine-specific kinase [bacterium]|nr:adenosine-specific kinase [bacterium]
MEPKIEVVNLEFPENTNIILGHSHFIKTIEDMYEIMVTTAPNALFGIAFSEASADRLIRTEGNDPGLITIAADNLRKVACGHSFLILLKKAYPINVLNAVKNCQEVCRIYCATANPTQVVVARTEQGGAVLGVVDGYPPLGTENDDQRKARRAFLREIVGYKF